MGNFTMLLRYQMIGGPEGIRPETGLVVGGTTIALCALVGMAKAVRMDILEKER